LECEVALHKPKILLKTF